ncbi:NADPH-dependent FMN reductase [Salarchaeum japonicum]|uniref:FMN reductase n=1 Tax=Salarchaeum japonicum TaxID=555573 RepID=A0AAV3T2P7_9EURY|nr:NAD(P)H-dependent oxidoreductase [Salarchaeum japonicum]
MTHVLGIVGSVSEESKTKAAVERALGGAPADAETSLLHLAEYDLDTADGRGLENYTGDTADALQRVVDADAYVVGTPVYRGSCSGLLKNFLDMVPRGIWAADVAPFEDAAVGLVATGATDHHYLAIDQELRPLFGFFGAHTVGGAVYASDDDFDDYDLADDDIGARLETLGAATVELDAAIGASDALAALGPQF